MRFRFSLLLAIILSTGCGVYDERYSLDNQNAKIKELGSQIFIMGIHGRGTPTREPGDSGYRDAGVSVLIDRLQLALAEYQIPPANLRKLQWNADYENPAKLPDPDYIEGHMPVGYFTAPAYTAIIGHSFGGYAGGLVSESYLDRLGYQPDYLATIDPVHGWRNNQSVSYFADYKQNWYQTNGITPVASSLCLFEQLSCKRKGSVSCGKPLSDYGFDRIDKLNQQHNSDGRPKSMRCLGIRFAKPQVHTTIDGDGAVHLAIIEKIVDDIALLFDHAGL